MLYVKFVCVKLMYVKFVCVKLLYVKFIVVYVRRREEEAGGGEGARDTESKTRTPHKDVGKKDFGPQFIYLPAYLFIYPIHPIPSIHPRKLIHFSFHI